MNFSEEMNNEYENCNKVLFKNEKIYDFNKTKNKHTVKVQVSTEKEVRDLDLRNIKNIYEYVEAPVSVNERNTRKKIRKTNEKLDNGDSIDDFEFVDSSDDEQYEED